MKLQSQPLQAIIILSLVQEGRRQEVGDKRQESLSSKLFNLFQLDSYFCCAALVSVASTQNDPLIDRGGERVVDIGVALLAVVLVFVVWQLSPRVEHAIIFALVLSIALIAFFWIR
jgi:hypothetical protein